MLEIASPARVIAAKHRRYTCRRKYRAQQRPNEYDSHVTARHPPPYILYSHKCPPLHTQKTAGETIARSGISTIKKQLLHIKDGT
jgi:hypothetical protein